MAKFLVDAQLPPALASFLKSAGHTAEHVAEVGLKNADDSSIWDYAIQNHATILTKDENFAERTLLSSDGPTIVWLRIGNCSNRAILHWFTPLLPSTVEKILNGERLIEIV